RLPRLPQVVQRPVLDPPRRHPDEELLHRASFDRPGYRTPLAVNGHIVIPRRFNGPPDSANGGYTCGRIAAFFDGTPEITLRRPPPLERELDVVQKDGRLELRDAGEVIAEAEPTELELDVPPPPTLADADEASTRYAGFGD